MMNRIIHLFKNLKKRINFTIFDVKNGNGSEAKHWNRREHVEKTVNKVDHEAWKYVKKPKKVKPGYKKKMKKQQEQIKTKLQSKNRNRNINNR